MNFLNSFDFVSGKTPSIIMPIEDELEKYSLFNERWHHWGEEVSFRNRAIVTVVNFQNFGFETKNMFSHIPKVSFD